MQYNYLGRTGLLVSQLGYGNMVNFQPQDEEENTAIIKRAYEAGVNFFDTAEIYENGKAEQQLGRSLKVLNIPREKVVITTKFLSYTTPDYNIDKQGNHQNRFITLNRKHLREAIDQSLTNLQLDYVDVVYAHNWDPETPISEIVRGFNDIIEDGKAFYWAVSNWSASQIQQAINFCDKNDLIRPVVDQSEYHLLERKKQEVDFVPLYENYGFSNTTYSPLCGGFLTGKYLEGVPEDSRCGKDNGWYRKERASNRFLNKYIQNPKVVEGMHKFIAIAKELDATPAQLALAWVMRSKDVAVAITGARSVKQFDETLKSIDILKKFDANLDQRLEEVFQNKPIRELDMRTLQPAKSRR